LSLVIVVLSCAHVVVEFADASCAVGEPPLVVDPPLEVPEEDEAVPLDPVEDDPAEDDPVELPLLELDVATGQPLFSSLLSWALAVASAVLSSASCC
jgi:hypothetical protein